MWVRQLRVGVDYGLVLPPIVLGYRNSVAAMLSILGEENFVVKIFFIKWNNTHKKAGDRL